MARTCGVYRIRCKVKGYFYVGSAANVHKRIERHFRSLRKGEHHNIFMQRVFNKYGEESFACDYQLDRTTAKAREHEQVLLDRWHGDPRFMNIGMDATGGDNLTRHPKREYIVRKMTRTNRRRMRSLTEEERRAKYGQPGERNGMFGKTHSPEARAALSKAHKGHTRSVGRVHTELGKIRSREAALANVARADYVNPFKGKHHSKETRAVMSKVAKDRVAAGVMPSNTLRVKVGKKKFRSAAAAAEYLGCVTATILNRVRNPNFPDYSFLD